jgi:hypothetical protein
VVDVDETKKQITDHGDALNKVVQNVPSLPACSMASVALRGMWSSGSLPDTLETLKTAYADPAYRLAADSLRADCFETLASGAAEGLPAQSVGVFVSPDGFAYCTGYLIAIKQVATARHCFYSADSGENTFVANSQFFYLSDPTHGFAVVDPGPTSGDPASIPLWDDHIVVSLTSSSDHAPLQIAALIPSQPLRVAGPLLYVAGRWQDQLVWSLANADCAVQATTDEHCIVHTCVTSPGFSGAPLLQRQAGTWRVVGMHLGGTARQCDATDGDNANIGLLAMGLN